MQTRGSTPRRIQSYDTTVVVAVAVAMIVGSILVLGLLEPGHPAHSHASPSPTPSPVATRRLLSLRLGGEQDARTVLDDEMRKRGYAHLAVASNRQFTAVARNLFPNANKPVVTDVYAQTAGEAHWMVVASANAASPTADWDSGMVIKQNGSYVFSRAHADLHKDVRGSVQSTLTSQ